MKEKIYKERENEFIKVISYFKIFITNNFNVYSSFKATLPYASIWLKEEIEKLLNEIDVDKSIQPFINFASLGITAIVSIIIMTLREDKRDLADIIAKTKVIDLYESEE
jgi:hypothetical protein